MRLRRGAALFLFALFVAPVPAVAHKDDYLADTFVFVTLARGELELEYWLDGRTSPRGALHTFGAEYGLTDRLMGDVSLRWFERSGGPLALEEGTLRLRRTAQPAEIGVSL